MAAVLEEQWPSMLQCLFKYVLSDNAGPSKDFSSRGMNDPVIRKRAIPNGLVGGTPSECHSQGH